MADDPASSANGDMTLQILYISILLRQRRELKEKTIPATCLKGINIVTGERKGNAKETVAVARQDNCIWKKRTQFFYPDLL
jgi:hypothetical protein